VLACQPAVANIFAQLVAFGLRRRTACDQAVSLRCHGGPHLGKERFHTRSVGDGEFSERLPNLFVDGHGKSLPVVGALLVRALAEGTQEECPYETRGTLTVS